MPIFSLPHNQSDWEPDRHFLHILSDYTLLNVTCFRQVVQIIKRVNDKSVGLLVKNSLLKFSLDKKRFVVIIDRFNCSIFFSRWPAWQQKYIKGNENQPTFLENKIFVYFLSRGALRWRLADYFLFCPSTDYGPGYWSILSALSVVLVSKLTVSTFNSLFNWTGIAWKLPTNVISIPYL